MSILSKLPSLNFSNAGTNTFPEQNFRSRSTIPMTRKLQPRRRRTVAGAASLPILPQCAKGRPFVSTRALCRAQGGNVTAGSRANCGRISAISFRAESKAKSRARSTCPITRSPSGPTPPSSPPSMARSRFKVSRVWSVPPQSMDQSKRSSVRANRCFVIPADVPLVPSRVYTRLLESTAGVVVPTWSGRRGHPVCCTSAVIPLILFASDRRTMGRLAIGTGMKLVAWPIAGFITVLNVWLLWATIAAWF